MAKVKLTTPRDYLNRPLNISDPELYGWLLHQMVKAGLQADKCSKIQHRVLDIRTGRPCQTVGDMHVRI